MKKFIVLFLLIPVVVWAADTKITGLAEDAAPQTTDLIVTVDDPGGSPVNKKAEIGNLPISTATQTALDAKVNDTGNESIGGVKTFTSDPIVPAEVYGAGWNGSNEVPTKNDVYDKVETLGAGSGDVSGVGDCTSGDCLDGTSDGGTYIRLYDGSTYYMQLGVETSNSNHTLSLPPSPGTTGQLMKSDGDNTTSWTSSLNLAFRDTNPTALGRDSDAAGADDADEDTWEVVGNMTTTTEDGEVSDMWLNSWGGATPGTKYTNYYFDSSDEALYLGITSAGTTTDVAGSEKIKIDVNTANDGEVLINSPDSGYITINHTSIETDFIPIAYANDGATPAADAALVTSTNKALCRAFDGAANEDMKILWRVPDDIDTTAGIKFAVTGYIGSATAPANTEVIAFSLAGVSFGNSDIMSGAVGTAQTSSLTADATYVQYDKLETAFSSAITVTNLTAGETAHLDLIRLATSTDTYAQDFHVAGVVIKYKRLNDASF